MKENNHIDLPVPLNGSETATEGQERYTEEIQDIITKVPSWVMRWGILVFFCVLLTVAIISAIVRYPDIVKGRISFQAVEKDLAISPGLSAIKQVTIQPNALVKEGQLLAVIVNSDNESLNIISPIEGIVGFASIAQPGTTLKAQQPLFVIHPLNQHYFGLIQLPVTVSDQVKTGQNVLISIGNKTDNQLKGKISAMTNEPDKSGMVTVKVQLDNPHDLKNWMTGNAQIMTKNISVGERILNSVLKKM